MNADELKASLQYFSDNYDEIGIAVYVLLKSDESLEPKKLDIEADSLPDLKRMFVTSLHDNIAAKDDLSVLNLSSSDERLDAIYLYDIEIPPELKRMEAVVATDNLLLFSFTDDKLSNIRALLVEIGNNEKQLVLYKTLAPVNVFGQSSFFLKKSDKRFEKINEEFLRLSPGFQLLRVDDKLFVVDLGAIEKSLGFHDVIIREAKVGLEAIQCMGILENPETLIELVDDVKYARRLTKVAKSSPVLKAGIDNTSIIKFCKLFPELKGEIRFNNAGDQIQLDTKVSKDLFIKLLMDDFLTSELTSFHYTSVAKDNVEIEVAE